MQAYPELSLSRFSRLKKTADILNHAKNPYFNDGSQNKAQYFSTFMSAGATSLSVIKHETYVSIHAGPPVTSWDMNSLKGVVTEKAMDRGLMTGTFESTHWSVATPDKIGNKGIDGIYFRTDRNGNLKALMVAEAKYGSSKLGKTTAGLQMSRTWTVPRLERTARLYSNIGKEIYNNGAHQTRLQPPTGAKVMSIPYKDGKTISVWKQNGKVVYYSDEQVSANVVAQQAKRTAQTLNAAANGSIEYRSSVVRIDVKDGQWKIEIQKLDTETAKPIGAPQQIPFNQEMKKQLAKSLEEAFVQDGCSREKAKALAEKCIKDPEYWKQMRRAARMNWKSGLDIQTLKMALYSGAITLGISLATSLFFGNQIDWKRTLGMSLLTTGSVFIGQYAGIQLASALLVTDVGKKLMSVIALKVLGISRLANMVGGFFGGIVTSALVSYAGWFLGYYDFRTANRSMASGTIGSVGGIVVCFGAQSAVVAFGAASTGTAISSLSGAAAANATLAWFGGGSIAAGGFGASAGLVVLTGGTMVVAIVLGAGVSIIFQHMDKNQRKVLINGKINLLQTRVSQGKQPEWQMA
jgi:hypothetical protein